MRIGRQRTEAMLNRHRALAENIYFLLTPKFSMLGFSMAVEALRLTNRVIGHTVYRWHVVSKTGQSVMASNGISVGADCRLDTVQRECMDPTRTRMVIVCSGIEVETFDDPTVFGWLRRLHSLGVAVGGLCTGAWVLARAGLLNNRCCAIHWENLPGFAERFPGVVVKSCLFEVDHDIYTCAGGTAPLDMMLHLIGQSEGEAVVGRVCELCLVDRIRPAHDRQRLPLGARVGIQNPRLLSIIELMEANVAEPLSLAEISHKTGISRRHVERLFRQHLARSPARYYLDVRLERARRLLRHSSLPIVEVAIASGFVSASHFSKRYRERYGVSPQADRREYEPEPDALSEISVLGDAGFGQREVG